MKPRLISGDELDQFATGVMTSHRAKGAWRAQRLSEYLWKNYRARDGHALRMMQPTGVRLRFRTDASELRLCLRYGERSRTRFTGALIVSDRSGQSILPVGPDHWQGEWEGSVFTASIQEMREFDLWLPHMGECDVVGMSVSENSAVEPLEKLPISWLAFGDSITHGMETPLPTDTAISRCALALNAEVINAAIGGGCIEASYAENLPEDNYDLITIAFGANDFHYGVPPETFAQLTRELVDACRSKYSDAGVVVITPLTDMKANLRNSIGMTISDYREALGNLSQTDGVVVVPGNTLVPQMQEFFVDDVHPNRAGFHHYSENLIPYLQRALQWRNDQKPANVSSCNWQMHVSKR